MNRKRTRSSNLVNVVNLESGVTVIHGMATIDEVSRKLLEGSYFKPALEKPSEAIESDRGLAIDQNVGDRGQQGNCPVGVSSLGVTLEMRVGERGGVLRPRGQVNSRHVRTTALGDPAGRSRTTPFPLH